MSESDKMFEELGYIKEENSIFIKYSKETKKRIGYLEQIIIRFFLESKTVIVETYYMRQSRATYLTMQELKAINLKVKELGFIND